MGVNNIADEIYKAYADGYQDGVEFAYNELKEVIKNWDDYFCVVIGDFVTHWMPLPDPPKEDETWE